MNNLPSPPEALYNNAIMLSERTATAGASTGVIGFLLSSPGIGLLGVAVAFIGVMVGVYFQWRRDQREHKEHLLRVAELEEAIREEESK